MSGEEQVTLEAWMDLLVHEVEDPFLAEDGETSHCGFCRGPVEHILHGKSRVAETDEVLDLRKEYFAVKRDVFQLQGGIKQAGLGIPPNELMMRRLEYLINIVIRGSLEPADQLALEIGWEKEHKALLQGANDFIEQMREATAQAGIYVPKNAGGLVVPGDANFLGKGN